MITLESVLNNEYMGFNTDDISVEDSYIDVAEAIYNVNIAVEKTNAFDCALMVLESAGDTTIIQMEGFIDAVKNFFKKIWEAVKKFWVWITGPFRNETKDTKSKIDDTKKKVEENEKKEGTDTSEPTDADTDGDRKSWLLKYDVLAIDNTVAYIKYGKSHKEYGKTRPMLDQFITSMGTHGEVKGVAIRKYSDILTEISKMIKDQLESGRSDMSSSVETSGKIRLMSESTQSLLEKTKEYSDHICGTNVYVFGSNGLGELSRIVDKLSKSKSVEEMETAFKSAEKELGQLIKDNTQYITSNKIVDHSNQGSISESFKNARNALNNFVQIGGILSNLHRTALKRISNFVEYINNTLQKSA